MISVVIPAYNEEKNIVDCLTSLVNQKTKRKFEVIVVDNASVDKTTTLAKKFSKLLNLKVVSEANKGRGAARAKGFSVTKGDIILSTDADVILPDDWIESLANKMEATSAVALTGTSKVSDCTPFKNSIISFTQPITMHLYRLLLGHYWLSGFNFSITKTAYLNSGGFDKKLNAFEDIDLAIKVNQIGKIKYVNSPKVTFSGRRFDDNFIKACFDYCKMITNYFILKKKNPKLSDIR